MPAAFSAAIPLPATFGLGSIAPMITLLTPFVKIKSQQGGVLP